MCITINAIESCTDIPSYITAEEIKDVTLGDEHLSVLAVHTPWLAIHKNWHT